MSWFWLQNKRCLQKPYFFLCPFCREHLLKSKHCKQLHTKATSTNIRNKDTVIYHAFSCTYTKIFCFKTTACCLLKHVSFPTTMKWEGNHATCSYHWWWKMVETWQKMIMLLWDNNVFPSSLFQMHSVTGEHYQKALRQTELWTTYWGIELIMTAPLSNHKWSSLLRQHVVHNYSREI